MQIATREQLRAIELPTEVVPAPELGQDVAVRVRPYTVAARAAIAKAAMRFTSDGRQAEYDPGVDQKLSLIACLAEPQLDLAADGEWIDKLPASFVDRVLSVANRLGGSTQPAYDAFKSYLRENPYLRRIYVACQELYGRLPSELEGVSESEFQMALAAMELEAEERRKAAG